jgi:S-methylmethionine-dependent homocysteine/selenocysteine methylase
MTLSKDFILLDGGMGRELERMGAPFRQPEWSALALIEAPSFVLRAHLNYIAAGAQVITTNSYAIVPFHIGAERFARDGQNLADRAGRLAREAAEKSGGKDKVLVAGSLPPLFGSYLPALFDEKRAPAILQPLVAGLSPYIDLWLAETQSSIREALAARAATIGDARPFWVSFTLEDDTSQTTARLRSGESVFEAAKAAAAMGAAALLFNCSQPEVMADALASAKIALAGVSHPPKLGVYANAFPPQSKESKANAEISPLRAELDPRAYCAFAQRWIDCGASIIGGCCGIGPDHIAAVGAMVGATRSVATGQPTAP